MDAKVAEQLLTVPYTMKHTCRRFAVDISRKMLEICT